MKDGLDQSEHSRSIGSECRSQNAVSMRSPAAASVYFGALQPTSERVCLSSLSLSPAHFSEWVERDEAILLSVPVLTDKTVKYKSRDHYGLK
ncbi:Uncharacterized protein DAT39_004560 [Clarias magur]|uniref:Uncharacterized protein n=1 Tax=Clarias magur TaxID=1594786 RepID=A0A8J4UTQ3_CLAMG|nr:Uncharacterized protein DAT39_004560 [Clarias magur]